MNSEACQTTSETLPEVDAAINHGRPLYFACGDRNLFGWYHDAKENHSAQDCAVVICNPIGYEYTHSYRSLRSLANTLAKNGTPTLRFDYDATGNSPGEDLSPDRLQTWLTNIRAAISTAGKLSGRAKICLVGVRMGATLAALIASQDEIAQLVLWNPCVNGRHYVREMKALSSAAATDSFNEHGFESAGFVLLHETAESIKEINLLKLNFKHPCNVLLIQRDDMACNDSLLEHLHSQNLTAAQVALPGYTGMMETPQHTVIPLAAIQFITQWLSEHSSRFPPAKLRTAHAAEISLETCINAGETNMIERYCQFGREQNMFGIISSSQLAASNSAKPAIVFLNSGSVHHVGPHRLYVTLARKLAALGYLCFRFDLQGLGDSALSRAGAENNPYPDFASADVKTALQYLRSELGCSRFILTGLCSGAHAAFHAAVDLPDHGIAEVILINPLTYRFVEGMSLDALQDLRIVNHYKGSARNLRSWLKLLSGKVDVIYLAKFATTQLMILIKTISQYMQEQLFNIATTELSAELRKLFAQKTSMALFVSTSEPGYTLLTSGAKFMARKGIKSKLIRVNFIADADHTFSQLAHRQDFMQKYCDYVRSRY